MYDSGISATAFIADIKNEADISVVIPDSAWYRWLNTVEQNLYSEFLEEFVSSELTYDGVDVIPLSSLIVPVRCASVVYDDIVRVFADDIELDQSGAAGIGVFDDKNLFYTDYAGNLIVQCEYAPAYLRIIHRLRPRLKEVGSTDAVAVPPEFLDMVAAKMRGEAYKIANEDGLAAKWLADYNAQLESFKVWAAARNKRFGG